ncbi:MAG: DNA methyltransferase [Muribaculaceae bacterium]|nr:DNA methyltransferase [Muribaculaceae bacterium]
MANSKLQSAKNAKNDEFYTQFHDIEMEMNAYLEYNPDVFRGKTILLPCDDPEWSNFTKYFAAKFDDLGIKKLISTSFAPESKKMVLGGLFSEWEQESPQFDADKSKNHGKIFVLERDVTGDGRINIDDLEWGYLDGNGDFRSEEVTRLRDEADIIVTNPPFSLFKEFFGWLLEGRKLFIIISNKNCITYKEVFPHIMRNQVWSGFTSWSGGMWFQTANNEDVDKVIDGKNMKNVGSIFITNIEHGRRHQPLSLMTQEDNIRFSKHKEIRCIGYYHYDNYDALEIPFTDSIPSDYEGIMGVPISWIEKYCPEQFEILGMCENLDLYNLKTKIYNADECRAAYYDKFKKSGTYDLNASGVIIVNGIKEKVYQRILIRKKS